MKQRNTLSMADKMHIRPNKKQQKNKKTTKCTLKPMITCLLIGLGILPLFLPEAQAQTTSKKNERVIYGAVENKLTREPIYDTWVELLMPDSTVIDSCKAGKGNWDRKPVAHYFFENVGDGEYLLRYTNPKFETSYRPIKLKFQKREFVKSIGYTYLDRKQKDIKLKEATVRATKVKIYTKNDTLVYNADAFQLAEGSMLDVLIRQLPGVELRDNGQILVNGRVVESLLLNGEDFVQADRSLMLQNLPSYMVKDVKVYDRVQGRLNRQLGEDGPKEMVMDVNLKRQYAIGWIGNVEGGMGSKDRFMARLFAMRFTPHSRITFAGNINNVSDTRTPGQDDSWTPDQQEGGRKTYQHMFMEYMVNDVNKEFHVNGYARLDNTNSTNEYRRNRENFLSSGNTYERSMSTGRENWFRLYSNHEWSVFVTENSVLTLKPHVGYAYNKNKSKGVSGTFLEDPLFRTDVNLLDSLYNPQSGALIRRILMNRSTQQSRYKYHRFDTNLDANYTYIFSASDDRLEIGAMADYANQDEYTFRQYLLDYPLDGSKPTDFRNEYNKARPERRNKLSGRIGYRYHATPNLTITPSYRYDHNYSLNRRSLYRLDQLEGWEEGTDHAFGTLPSTEDWKLQTLDATNSLNAQLKKENHRTGVNAYWEKKGEKAKQSIQMDLDVHFQHQKLDYKRDGRQWTPSRHATFFAPYINYNYTTLDWRNYVQAHYHMSSSMPSMTSLVDFRDENNPLFITQGNPGLENTHSHHLSLSYQKRTPKKQRYFNAGINANITQNATAMGYTYDRQTGVRTSRPENVNGNWSMGGNVGYSTPLDKNKRWMLNSNTNANYYHNVDLYGLGEQEKSIRSTVGWTYLTEELKLDYSFSKLTIGAKAKATWGHADGSRSDFETINTADMIYGLRGQIRLPWQIQLSTDMNLYSRRGYNDKAMNTDDFVWNARISKSVMNGNLVLMVDGFDILGNLSNVTRTLNAQGRTETYRNVVPRYVMVHAIYRLNIKPKKKPGEA